jgi:hypothetical protein
MKALQFGSPAPCDFHPLRCSAEASRLGHPFTKSIVSTNGCPK